MATGSGTGGDAVATNLLRTDVAGQARWVTPWERLVRRQHQFVPPAVMISQLRGILCQLLTPLSPLDQPAAGHHSSDGLGLAVAKFIAEAHGGKLTIQSAIGNGTTASIYLPADLISLADQDAEAA